MVLSGLANSFRRLLSHIRQSALSSCSRGEGDMEHQEDERAVQTWTRCSSAASAALEEKDGAMERPSTERLSSGNVQNRHAPIRMVPIKRKLEELELGAGGLSASQARPRRETRDDLSEGASPELSGSERNCADSRNSFKAQPLDVESDGNTATDPDAMWEGEVPWSNSSDAWPDDARVSDNNKDLDTGRGVVRVSDTGDDVAMASTTEEGNISKSFASCAVVRVESSAKEPLDYADSLVGKAMEDFQVLDSGDFKTSEAGRTGTDLASLKEGDSRELETIVRRRPETGFDAGRQEIKASITGSASSSKGGFLCDENFSSSGNGRHSLMLLQFFVRTYIDGRTIVLHGNAFDTVESVHRQIFLKTGLPLSEQRLIYFGRQLQHDQTLADCRVANDATLYLVARMRSTALPHSWQLINDLVATIRRTCAMEPEEGKARYNLMQSQLRIRSGVKDFLKMAMKSAPFSEHMQVFQLAGATSALVMLLLSPIESNCDCAEESIKLFFCSNEDCLPAHNHSHCTPVLLDFCKLLAKSAPSHSLYPVCRNALACLLDTVGATNGGSYFHEVKAETIVHDFAPFVNELSISLCSNLRWTAMEYSIKERSARFPSYVKDGQDFTAFVLLLCKAMEACKGIGVSGSSSDENEGSMNSLTHSSTVGTLNKADLGRGSLGSVDEVEDKDGAGVEIGSQRWLQWLFHELLQALDGCLAAIQLTERSLEPSELAISDEKPFGWAPFLVVLKGLHAIAKLYEGALEDLLGMLQTRWSALNLLIKQSRWQDDNSWLLDHKFLLNFESKRRLVMAMLPEPQDDHDERQEIVVPRSKLLTESFEALAYADPDALQGGISLEFISEEATGPGVLREWFLLICREIFNPQNALFKSCPNDGRRVFPNPASGVNPGHLTYFRFSGRVIALALMHRVQINVVFSLAFFKQLAGLPISWQDARDADPILYESCRKILQMDAEDIDSDVLGLSFVCEEQQLGAIKTVELCPGGKDMSVNSKNRLVYVEYLVRQRFVTSVAEQVRSFSQGFSELFATGNLEQFFRGLEAEDFDLILHGNGQVICLEDWKLHTEYHEYNQSDDQIIWFWQVLEGMTNEQRRKLLFFSTSVTHLPAEGFEGLSSKFHIHKGHTETTWLPTAHTCFFQLILPLYPSFEVMREKLLALTEGHIAEGFGFA